jgi:hypothetical protein
MALIAFPQACCCRAELRTNIDTLMALVFFLAIYSMHLIYFLYSLINQGIKVFTYMPGLYYIEYDYYRSMRRNVWHQQKTNHIRYYVVQSSTSMEHFECGSFYNSQNLFIIVSKVI